MLTGGGEQSCLISVVGETGEVNPLPATPLKLISVANPQNCDGIKLEVFDETQLRASWLDETPGAAECTADFVVQDAQGRQSTGERQGQIVLDLQGLPAAPSRLEWVGYTESSVQLRPVMEASSYPAVTSYTITGGPQTVTCSVNELCEISGLTPGTKTQFSASAVNAVGVSRGAASVNAWAYSPPKAPQKVTWKPIPAGLEGGKVLLKVDGIDVTTASLKIETSSTSETFNVTDKNETITFNVGSNTPQNVTITPITRFQLPPEDVGGGSSAGKKYEIFGVHGVGAPMLDAVVTASPREHQLSVTALVNDNGATQQEIGFAIDGASCEPDGVTSTRVFDDLKYNRDYTIKVCARHVLDGVKFATRQWVKSGFKLEIPPPEGERSYSLNPVATERSPGVWEWGGFSTPIRAPAGYELRFSAGNIQNVLTLAELFPIPGEGPTGELNVKSCEVRGGDMECGKAVALEPLIAKYAPRVEFEETADESGTCVADDLRTANLVRVSGLNDLVEIEMKSSDTSRWLHVSFKGTGLQAVESPKCKVAPENDEED